MAIVRAPLFSFGAKQSLANALTFSSWKGLNVVKKWFIPANPNSAAQQLVRGHFLDATQDWERVRLSAIDKAAWNLRAQRQKNPQSGYNRFVGLQVEELNLGWSYTVLEHMLITPGDAQLDLVVQVEGDTSVGLLNCYYGTGPTRMNTVIPMVWDAVNHWYDLNIPALVTGTKYYIECRLDISFGNSAQTGTFTATPI